MGRVFGKITVLVGLLSIIFGAGTASASSVYDNSYQTTNAVKIYKSGQSECNNIDLTANWAEYILDKNKWYDLTQISNPTSTNNQMRNSLIATLADENYGTWSVSQLEDSPTHKRILVSWTKEPGASLQWGAHATLLQSGDVWTAMIACSDQYGDSGNIEKPVSFLHAHYYAKSISETTGDLKNLFLYSNQISAVTYPSGYEGELVNLIGPESGDMDEDGLAAEGEYLQGTSDFKKDTDGDGLSDYIESTSFSNRADIFCGALQCAYPDPLVKDIYIELDWMNDSINSRLLKPSATQLAYVEDMFDDKSINIHIDTGQYGGGNALPLYMHGLRTESTSEIADFGDFKDGGDGITANFAANRHSIWKYMIYGYGYLKSNDPNYPNLSDSSGLAEVSGDDIFVSGGIVEDASGLVSVDRAVANTIAHEIGHTLCLSPTQIYQEQNTGCVYNGIDNDSYKPENYLSVMNYRYQLTDDDDMGVVNYSNGSNGTGDHDDWSGVLAGMGDFNGTQTQLGSKRVFAKNKTMDPDKIVQEVLPVKVKTDNSNDKQAALPLLASIQSPSGPSQSQSQYTRPSEDGSGLSMADSNNFDWTMAGLGGFVALGVIGASVFHCWHRR